MVDAAESLGLRPLALDDANLVLSWRNRPEVREFMYTNHVITSSEHDAWMRSAVADERRSDFIILLDGGPVGLVSLYDISRRHQRAEWAFYLADTRTRGKGVGSAVEYWALRHAFEELQLQKLSCAVLAFNSSVIAMHEKFGFQREGCLREHIRRDDGAFDVILFGMTRTDWLGCRESNLSRVRLRLPEVGFAGRGDDVQGLSPTPNRPEGRAPAR